MKTGRGLKDWYQKFCTRICRVESQRSFDAVPPDREAPVDEAQDVTGQPD